jgi:hypothetical protein
VALAILLRLRPILVEPSAVWPDEIFQTSEPAHRLVFGSGLVAWEFQLGVRSWLLPGIIAGLMELSRIIGDGPDYYLPVIAVGFAGLAAAPVVCCFLWCRPLFGITGALLAGLAVRSPPNRSISAPAPSPKQSPAICSSSGFGHWNRAIRSSPGAGCFMAARCSASSLRLVCSSLPQ